MKTKKSELLHGQLNSVDKGNIFTGYGLTSTKLDVANDSMNIYETLKRENTAHNSNSLNNTSNNTNNNDGGKLTQVDLTQSLPPPTASSIMIPPKTGTRNDTTLEELRNYIVLMDQYSLHNFLIYEGKTLKDTPEFQSFQRTYQYKWGSISSIIYQLEDYMTKNDIKLAIINGPRVYELAKLNLPILKKPELYTCIANIEQIELTSNFGNDISRKQMIGMLIKIQSLIRTFLAVRRYQRRRRILKSAVKIQSMSRLLLEKARYRIKKRKHYQEIDEKFRTLQEQFKYYWKRASILHNSVSGPGSSRLSSTRPSPRPIASPRLTEETLHEQQERFNHNNNMSSLPPDAMTKEGSSKFPSPRPPMPNDTTEEPLTNNPTMNDLIFPYDMNVNSQKRLIILLPSIHTSQYIRLEYENYGAMENTLISNLYLLADENVHLIYISPFLITNYQYSYYEKFLALMGISILPKRLTIITPELIDRLPSHLTLSQQLWCSTIALNRIKQHIRQMNPSGRSNNAYIICSSFSWAEKRIANYLNIPILGPDTTMAETIQSRSWLKEFYYQTGVNYPIGSHDIFSTEELYLALTRLIAANLGVMRWNIKLNYDYNLETILQLDVEKLSLILELRSEQFTLCGDKDNTASWFSRPIQLAIRKRILTSLQKEFLQKVKIYRRDIFPTYDLFQRLIKLYGAVIEAEPIEKIGYLISMIFINPLGEITMIGSAQEYCDDGYQVQGYCYPQTLIPPIALNGVSHALGSKLYQEYGIIGYINLHFVSLWDDLDQQPRLWATDIKFGITSLHGAFGTASIITSSEAPLIPFNLLPTMPEGRSFVYIPIASHEGLKSTHDDAFFKLCRMRGIAFDTENRIGTLFFLPDTIVTGNVSIICMGRTRRKSLEIAVAAINFVFRNFGMDADAQNSRKPENLSKILISLKKALKNEPEETPFVY